MLAACERRSQQGRTQETGKIMPLHRKASGVEHVDGLCLPTYDVFIFTGDTRGGCLGVVNTEYK
jgi:hypothetical protein